MADLSHSRAAAPSSPSHEKSDVEPRKIVLFGSILVIAIIIALVAGSALFHRFFASYERSQPPRSPLAFSPQPTPEPRLSVNPGEELNALRATEDALLKSRAWIDNEKGIARIPIDTAIEILAQKGLPARTEPSVKENIPVPRKVGETNPSRNEPTFSPAPPQRAPGKGEGKSSESGSKTGRH